MDDHDELSFGRSRFILHSPKQRAARRPADVPLGRLLKELRDRKVCCTHVCVNQLVTGCELDIAEAEGLLRSGGELGDAARRVMNAVTLCGARQKIQAKYLQTLRESDEAKALHLTVVRSLPWGRAALARVRVLV